MIIEKLFLVFLPMVVQLLKMYIMLILTCVIPMLTLQEATQGVKTNRHGHLHIF